MPSLEDSSASKTKKKKNICCKWQDIDRSALYKATQPKEISMRAGRNKATFPQPLLQTRIFYSLLSIDPLGNLMSRCSIHVYYSRKQGLQGVLTSPRSHSSKRQSQD